MLITHQVDKYIEIADWLAFDCRNDDEALNWINRALSLDPENPTALAVRGDILQNLGRFQDAIYDYDRALEQSPNMPDAVTERAQALCSLERWWDSLEACEHGLSLLPEDPEEARGPEWIGIGEALYETKAHCLFEIGRVQQSIVTLETGLSIYPNSQALLEPLKSLREQQ